MKFYEKVNIAILMLLLAASGELYAANTEVSVTPESYYTVYTGQAINARAAFYVRICNPTSTAITGNYRSTFYADAQSSTHADMSEAPGIASNTCFEKSYDSYVNVTFWSPGQYRLTGSITADGVENAETINYGWVTVYQR